MDVSTAFANPFLNASYIGVGFGTAALGGNGRHVVADALRAGFRKFDTAEENEYWYDQAGVGAALRDFFLPGADDGSSYYDDDETCAAESQSGDNSKCRKSCAAEDLRVSTKIPPWKLTSEEDIRRSAEQSRKELVGFCDDERYVNDDGVLSRRPFPLDVYYIHAPACWQGWHTRCNDPPPTLDLRDAWRAMEAVAGIDKSARRVGLSNVQPAQLQDIIEYVEERKASGDLSPPPRVPDVVQNFADPIEPADDIRALCRQHGIEFVSYSTLGTQHRHRSKGGKSGNPVLGSPIVESIAEKHNRSTAEVVLSWALQRGMSVIPRSTKKDHIVELSRLLVPRTKSDSDSNNDDDDNRNQKQAGGFLDAEDLKLIDSMKHSA